MFCIKGFIQGVNGMLGLILEILLKLCIFLSFWNYYSLYKRFIQGMGVTLGLTLEIFRFKVSFN